MIASGLLGYGTHELIEYAEEEGVELGWFSKVAYELNVAEGSVWSEEGPVGSILAALFGYATSMGWGRLLL